MKLTIILALTIFMGFPIGGCAVFAKVENAPYVVVEKAQDKDQKIELRTYEQMVLVSTSMAGADRNGAFRRLFAYISGANVASEGGSKEVPMTAPVFMDAKAENNKTENASQEIPMTAPVFMDGANNQAMMSFVMPVEYTLETTPKPTNPAVVVQEVKDYTVAAITFSGTLRQGNVEKHKALLEKWIADKGYKITGAYKMAGYNAPFTLPMLRRNEVIIPVEKP